MKLLFKDSDLFFEENKSSFRRDAVQAAAILGIFSVLTAITFYVGWINPAANAGSFNALVWILASSITGFIAIVLFLSVVAYKKIGRKQFFEAFFIMAYASTPVLLIGWIPNGLIKILAICWTVNFIRVGLETHSKKSFSEAVFLAILTGGATMALAAITEFYLIFYI